MNDLNFIKKGLPFADGFENYLETFDGTIPEGQEWVRFPDGTACQVELVLDFPMRYSHFLTRTIEGINRDAKFFLDQHNDGCDVVNKGSVILQKCRLSDNNDSFDDCKRSAIEYVFETMNDKHDNSDEIRAAFENTLQYKNAHSNNQAEDRYTVFEVGYKSRDEEVYNLLAENKTLRYLVSPDAPEKYFDDLLDNINKQELNKNLKETQALIEELKKEYDEYSEISGEMYKRQQARIKELEQAAITKSETYQSALDNIHKELECCGNCGARVYGTFDCGLNNILCDNWKQKGNK